MNAKIDGKDFSEFLKSSIINSCQSCLTLLADHSESNPHLVVHEVRKSFKKIRALLRLIRKGHAFYREENYFFRDEARRISEIRDKEAALEALNFIYSQYDRQLYKNVFGGFQDFLDTQRKSVEGKPIHDALNEIRNNLKEKYTQIDSWPIQVNSFEDIKPNIKRTYQRGVKGLAKSLDTPSTENFHDWRKRIKYLRYQIDLLSAVWPAFLNMLEDELHNLSDLLGTDRDLFLLSRLVEANQEQFNSGDSKYLLIALLNEHRNQMQCQAILLGQKVYNLNKGSFLGLLNKSWNVHQQQNSRTLSVSDTLEN